MAGISDAVSWAGKHPVTTAVGAFALGAVILLMMRGGGGGGSSGGNLSAFYAAQAAQAGADAQVRGVQAQTQAAVAINGQNVAGATQIASISAVTAEDLANIHATSDLNLLNADGWWQHIANKNTNNEINLYLTHGINPTSGQLTHYTFNPPTFGS